MKQKQKNLKMNLEKELDLEILITNDQEILKMHKLSAQQQLHLFQFLSDNYIADGTHINAIGSYQPTKREIPSATVNRANIFVDSREACLKEAVI